MTQAAAAIVVPSQEEDAWKHVLDLSCELTVELPISALRLSDLIRLNTHSVVSTASRLGRDLPLRVNGQLVAWCEFEVAGKGLAVRITELA
jgi:flagellar motor switch/type III secretory pathway protein FliN